MNKFGTKRRSLTKPLTWEDVQCPICIDLLIEPVKLPCNHELCKRCFEINCDLTSLQCPICRIRLSSWARKAKRNGMLVNLERWEEIQAVFPKAVHRRLIEGTGEDGNNLSLSNAGELKTSRPILSQPGEIKNEFNEMLRKFEEEKQLEKLKEEKASEMYIKELRLLEGSDDDDDEEEDDDDDVEDDLPMDFDDNSVNLKQCNTTEEFDLPSCSSSTTDKVSKRRSSSVESSDSITQEMSHFKPINAAPVTPPKKLYDGCLIKPNVIVSKARKLSFEDENMLQKNSHSRATCEKISKDGFSTKKFTLVNGQKEVYPLRENSNFIKTGKKSSFARDNILSLSKPRIEKPRESKLEKDGKKLDSQMSVLHKFKQEETDFLLAKTLQEKYDRLIPIKHRVDRRKGSGNEYNFRKTTKRSKI